MQLPRPFVGEFGVGAQDPFATEGALLQHPHGGRVLRMTERVQTANAEFGGGAYHDVERFSRGAFSGGDGCPRQPPST